MSGLAMLEVRLVIARGLVSVRGEGERISDGIGGATELREDLSCPSRHVKRPRQNAPLGGTGHQFLSLL